MVVVVFFPSPLVGFWLSFMKTSFQSLRTCLPLKRITVWSSRGPSAETELVTSPLSFMASEILSLFVTRAWSLLCPIFLSLNWSFGHGDSRKAVFMPCFSLLLVWIDGRRYLFFLLLKPNAWLSLLQTSALQSLFKLLAFPFLFAAQATRTTVFGLVWTMELVSLWLCFFLQVGIVINERKGKFFIFFFIARSRCCSSS